MKIIEIYKNAIAIVAYPVNCIKRVANVSTRLCLHNELGGVASPACIRVLVVALTRVMLV